MMPIFEIRVEVGSVELAVAICRDAELLLPSVIALVVAGAIGWWELKHGTMIREREIHEDQRLIGHHRDVGSGEKGMNGCEVEKKSAARFAPAASAVLIPHSYHDLLHG